MTSGAAPSTGARVRRLGGPILFLVAAVVLLADQWSKGWVQTHFPACNTVFSTQVIVPNWLALSYTCNSGAAFGLLADKTLLFVLIALVVSGVIVAYFRYLPTNRPWLKLSLGLQLGGALGNLLDRLHQGYVTDFISVAPAQSLPVFNIADSCIVVGVLILGYYLLAAGAQPATLRATEEPAPTGPWQRTDPERPAQ